MTLKEQLAQIRSQLSKLISQANSLPKVILQSKGLDGKIALLKAQERELIKKVAEKELYGKQQDAESEYSKTAEDEAAKTRKTLLIAGSVVGGLALIFGVIIIIKKLKKTKIKKQ